MATMEWAGLVILVVTACMSAMAFLYRMRMHIHKDMVDLDLRWQDRTDRLAQDIRQDIDSVRSQIPPDWFRSMVEKNTTRIENLERTILTSCQLPLRETPTEGDE